MDHHSTPSCQLVYYIHSYTQLQTNRWEDSDMHPHTEQWQLLLPLLLEVVRYKTVHQPPRQQQQLLLCMLANFRMLWTILRLVLPKLRLLRQRPCLIDIITIIIRQEQT
uniref:Uncharacterized protein n=1 Tax=Anopheles melas TaxID=34690 RepID=A0A182TFK3_9DIPT